MTRTRPQSWYDPILNQHTHKTHTLVWSQDISLSTCCILPFSAMQTELNSQHERSLFSLWFENMKISGFFLFLLFEISLCYKLLFIGQNYFHRHSPELANCWTTRTLYSAVIKQLHLGRCITYCDILTHLFKRERRFLMRYSSLHTCYQGFVCAHIEISNLLSPQFISVTS